MLNKAKNDKFFNLSFFYKNSPTLTDIELGKFISYILRHHPEDIGIKLDKNGYANVSDLITNVNATEKYHNELSEERLQRIVDTNDKLEETMPDYLLEEYKLLNLKDAINKIHFPSEFADFDKARNRLVFEELLTMQLLLLSLKNKYKNQVEHNTEENKNEKRKERVNQKV